MSIAAKPVAGDDVGLRLDQWLKKHYPQLGHGTLQKWLRKGAVRVDGARASRAHRLQAGAKIVHPRLTRAKPHARHAPRAPSAAEARDLRARVLYRDDDLLALNKPTGLAVQGGSRLTHHLDGFLDALRFGARDRPRLVHRLDKDTSGVLLLARHKDAAQRLTRAFAEGTIRKLYWGVVAGSPRRADGDIAEIASPLDRPARTRYVVCARAGKTHAFVAFSPLTGRRHQIRAHAASAGFPLVGDTRYGRRRAEDKPLSASLHLHARALVLADGISVTAPLPPQLSASWQHFGWPEQGGESLLAERAC